jgi:hypothetical protein
MPLQLNELQGFFFLRDDINIGRAALAITGMSL